MVASPPKLNIRWEKLPDHFILPDDPVDNINQPFIATALTDSLSIAGYLTDSTLTPTNYGICATFNDKTVVKAPDWAFIPHITVPRSEVERSYTPHMEGKPPLIVMEFLSATEGGEYSIKATHPPGKWFFYERILKVPYYVIFSPDSGRIEFYQLSESGIYQIQTANADDRYWLPEMALFLGVWQGTRETRTGPWLRWWNGQGNLLLWGKEQAEQERQRADQAEQSRDAAIRKLLSMGLSVEDVAEALGVSAEIVQAAQ
ncbi:MAG: Uma2 family endonuclease [Cyanobacteria bacterium P01_A01_bin.137]